MITIVEIGFTKYQVETLEDATTLMDIMERAKKVTYSHSTSAYKLDTDQGRDIEITMSNKPLLKEEETKVEKNDE